MKRRSFLISMLALSWGPNVIADSPSAEASNVVFAGEGGGGGGGNTRTIYIDSDVKSLTRAQWRELERQLYDEAFSI